MIDSPTILKNVGEVIPSIALNPHFSYKSRRVCRQARNIVETWLESANDVAVSTIISAKQRRR
jgi:hypothetical protein